MKLMVSVSKNLYENDFNIVCLWNGNDADNYYSHEEEYVLLKT